MFYRPIRAKAIAVIAKLGFANRLQYLLDTLLDQPVPDARDSQWSCFTIRLGNLLSSHWFGAIAVFAACNNFSDSMDNFGRRQPADVTHVLLVRACCVTACVRLDISVRQHDVI